MPSDFVATLKNTGPRAYDVMARADDGSYEVTRRGEIFRLDINERWDPSLPKLWQQYPIEEISLGGALGWMQADISFLGHLPPFTRLSLQPAGQIAWQILEDLAALEELRIITVPCRPVKDLDLCRLPKLRVVQLPWWPEFKSVMSHKTLQSLTLEDAKRLVEIDCRDLDALLELRLIRCRDCRTVSFSNKPSLVSFEVSVCPQFETVIPAAALNKLHYFYLHGPTRWDYRQIETFRQLRQLNLHELGELPTLKFLKALKNLEYVAFQIGTTISDGDLTWLDELPDLKVVAYDRSQQHYFPKRPQIWSDALKEKREASGWTF
jgi:hypothetical protein